LKTVGKRRLVNKELLFRQLGKNITLAAYADVASETTFPWKNM
jgi:hypothetical protein